MIRYHARWVLPVGAPPLRDATVVVDGEQIAWVGPRAAAPAGRDVDLGDAVLMPGFVNAHIHLDLAAFAGAIAPRDFFSWVRTLVRALTDVGTPAMLADASAWSVADQLAYGVTTMAHTGPGRAGFDALHAMGARGIAYAEVFGPDPAQCDSAIAALDAVVTPMQRDASDRVRVGVSPHAPYSVSDALYAATAAFASARGFDMAVHIAESADETALVVAGGGAFGPFLRARGITVPVRARSPIALLERTGVLTEAPLCIHAVNVDEADVRSLAAAGARVAHCPGANRWFAHGAAPLRTLRGARVVVGVGTDSAASNDAVRLAREAALATDPALTSNERLALATRDGARALGYDRVGTLAPGMMADLTAFRALDTAACDRDPAAYVLGCAATSPSLLTVVAGTVRAREGTALALDTAVVGRMEGYRAHVDRWRDALANAAPPVLDSAP